MRTEYMLTDEQKRRIAEIDRQIMDLEMKKVGILMMANCRMFTETKEEFNMVDEYYRRAMFGEPVIRNDAIVKINFGGNEDDKEIHS